MVKMVICSDTHLNAYYAKMRPEQLERRRERLRKAFQEAVDFAIEQKVDIFIHAGDLFDMPDPRYLEVIFAFKELVRLKNAGIRTFLIGGTHDIPKARYEGGGAPSLLIFEIANLAKVFRNFYHPQPEILDLDGRRIVLAGVSCDPRVREGNPFQQLQFTPPEGDLTIFMFHYAIEGRIPSMYEGAIVPLQNLRELPADLIIAGHLHPHSHFEIGNKLVIIPGAMERFDFGEEKNECGFYYLEWEREPIVKYQRVSAQPMRTLEVNVATINLHPKNQRFSFLVTLLKDNSHPDQLLKLKIFGEAEREFLQDVPLNRLLEEGNANNFYFDLDTRELRMKIPGLGGGEPSRTIDEEIREAGKSLVERQEELKELIDEAISLALSRWEEAR